MLLTEEQHCPYLWLEGMRGPPENQRLSGSGKCHGPEKPRDLVAVLASGKPPPAPL